MANTIGNFHTTPDALFNGVGDIVAFTAVIDASYASLSLSGLLNGKSIGDLYNGSTKFTGDAASITSIKNENGAVMYSYAEDGTFSFETVVSGMNTENVIQWLKGALVTSSDSSTTWQNTGAVHTGFGDAVASQYLPIAWFNREKNILVTIPKALVVATPVDQDKGIGMKLSFVAQKIPKTATINTVIISTGATANYTA